MHVCVYLCFSPYSIDKYRQLPTDDAENKNLDKRVSLLSRDSMFCLCTYGFRLTLIFGFCALPVDPPSHPTW